MESQTREMPPLEMRAAFIPSTVDREKRTVEVTWTTGARVLRGFWERFWEELSLDPKHVRMDRLNSGRAPFLIDHENSVRAIAGVVERAWLMKDEGRAKVRFLRAGVDPEVDMYFERVADGVAPNLSVGYRTYRMEKTEDGADKIPVFRAVDWEPNEISGVAIGADAGSAMRGADTEANICEVITRGSEPQTQKEHKMPEEQQTRAAQGDTPSPADTAAVEERARKEERARITGIRQAVRAAKLGDALAEKLVSEGKKLDEARAVVLDELTKRTDEVNTQPHIRVEVTDDASDKFRRGAEAWLIQKAGVQDVFRKAQAAKVDGFESYEKDPGEFRGLKLTELARMCLERGGVRTAGMSTLELVGKALTHKRSDAPGWGGITYARDGGFNTTSDFGVLLENILYKVLLGQYMITPDTWTKFCKTDTVQDFRPSNRYRLGSIGVLDSLNEAGEFKNKQIPDGEKHVITADTKGNIIALSRQAIINDDMAALANVAAMLGRAARLSIEVDVYALLAQNGGLGPTMTDGNPFFHASRGNVNATGSALTVTGVDADRVVMKSQKDPSGNELLDLKPEILVVPAGLGATARVVNTAVYDPDANNKLQRPNPVVGLYSEIVDTARLSGTRRYSFADPGIAPAIVVAFLEGANMAPYLEQHLGWRVDGTEWKVRIDYKVNIFDWRGAVTNAGA